MELLCFFSSDDFAEIENVKTLLEDNHIPVLAKNVYTQNLFGGLKPFSGHDPIAGSMQLFINESDVEKASAIIEDSGLFPPKDGPGLLDNEDPESTGADNHDDTDDREFIEKAKEKRDIYFASILTAMSFLIVPYLLNLFLLHKLGKKRKTISIMLLSAGTMICGASVFALLSGR